MKPLILQGEIANVTVRATLNPARNVWELTSGRTAQQLYRDQARGGGSGCEMFCLDVLTAARGGGYHHGVHQKAGNWIAEAIQDWLEAVRGGIVLPGQRHDDLRCFLEAIQQHSCFYLTELGKPYPLPFARTSRRIHRTRCCNDV